MTAAGTILHFIVHPFVSIRDICPKKFYASSLLTVFLSLVSLTLSLNVISNRGITVSSLLLRILLLSIIGLTVWICAASFFHLFAELFGGSGNVLTLLSLIGFSTAPVLLLTPISLTLMLFGSVAGLLYFLIFLTIVFWVIVLIIRAISVQYSIKSVQSVLVVFSPVYLIPFGISCIIFALIVITKISGSLKIISTFGR